MMDTTTITTTTTATSIWRSTLVSTTPYLISFVIFIIFLEQIAYLKKKRFLPGPALVLPFLGSVISLIKNPTEFWDTQAIFAKSSNTGFSANYIIGKFIVYIQNTELSHKVFSNVRPDAFHLIGHPFGKKLFGEHNLIYMTGQQHKDLRRQIAPNFTPKALSTYISLQQSIILQHLKSWESLCSANPSSPIELRLLCRDMNLDTSQTVFVGPYLNLESREGFNRDYNLFNVGLMNLPIDLPGFGFQKARLAVSRLIEVLGGCAKQSISAVKSGKEPDCLIDFWMQEIVSHPEIPQSSDIEMGSYLFDFLFAAQDASTSSLLWAVTLLDNHPEVLEKIRQEVSRIWSPESNKLISSEQLREMKYTEAVAREIIRYRPPATLVPHIAGVDFPLTETYTIPKGTIVFPSVFESSFQGFTDPDRFDPDRFSDERREDRLFKRNFLAFGAGAHQCVGQRYALNHLVLFLAMFTSLLDFRREKSDGCDDIIYVPTICPKDNCRVYLSRRCTHYPSF